MAMKKIMWVLFGLLVISAWVLGLANKATSAGEIQVISSVGMKAVLEEIRPQFERATGHTLALTFGTSVPLKRQIDAGETFDVVVLTPSIVEDLEKEGKVAPATRADIAKSGLGVAIRKGAPKPDISTPEAFKRTLVNAASIVYSKEGASGAYMARLIERLGLVEEMKPKTVLETRSGHPPVAVVEGKAELGFALISEILPIAEAEFAGPLPTELQGYVVFTAGVASNAKDVEAAKAFISFFRTPAVLPVLKAKGMEPG